MSDSVIVFTQNIMTNIYCDMILKTIHYYNKIKIEYIYKFTQNKLSNKNVNKYVYTLMKYGLISVNDSFYKLTSKGTRRVKALDLLEEIDKDDDEKLYNCYECGDSPSQPLSKMQKYDCQNCGGRKCEIHTTFEDFQCDTCGKYLCNSCYNNCCQ